MFRCAYVNGQYVSHGNAAVHIEDRGYQFADGVYEVIAVFGGKLVDEGAHMDRLHRSLGELNISWPMSRPAMAAVIRQVLRRNLVKDGMVYIQVTRGVAPRDHTFKEDDMLPSLVITAKNIKSKDSLAHNGIEVISMPDIRWGRCDIKTVSLLPNIMAKQSAKEKGAFEAWLIDEEGYVTEGAAANAWIITKGDELQTRALGTKILGGITRIAIMKLAKERGMTLVDKPFKLAEAMNAKEAFITSSTSLVLPVVKIDGKAIANGKPGPLVAELRQIYKNAALKGGAL